MQCTGSIGLLKNRIDRQTGEEFSLDAGPKRNLKVRYIAMLVMVCVAIVGWSGAWLYLRSILEGQIEAELSAMNRSGNRIECSDLSIAGYPFRFEVRCTGLKATDQAGTTVSMDELRAIALVYNPRHVIFEASGPVGIIEALNSSEITTNWSVAQSSILFSDGGARQIDVSIQEPVISLLEGATSGKITAEVSEIHLRPNPVVPDSLEAFITIQALSSSLASGLTEPSDVKLHIRLPGGMALLEGKALYALQKDPTGSQPLDLISFSVNSGNVRLTASGNLRLMPSGALSGKINVQVARLEAVIKMLTALYPEGSTLPSTIQGAATAFGVPGIDAQGRQQLSLPLTLDEGTIRIGIIPLGTIPPVLSNGT